MRAPDSGPAGYPFTAIVGQEEMRLALLLNAIDPRIGGVLIRGEKGTAKSTMARSLAELLPEQRVVRDCPYGCDPDDPAEQDSAHRDGGETLAVDLRPMRVVELPINAAEDRVTGTLDLRAALTVGEYRFEPGLLAAANRGILYVDEVNLLPDHLVDLVLDAAAMGRNTVEREGVSISHPARFVLIGTMNPEEGELRPQLLDRFGLCVEVGGIAEIDQRVQVMRRRMAFESDPVAFAGEWEAEQRALRERVVRGRALLPVVQAPDENVRTIAALAVEMGVDGHRADIVILRTASAIAAFEGRTMVTRGDVHRAAALALPHRLRRRPFEQQQFTEECLQEAIDRAGRVAEAEQERDDGARGEGQGAEDREQPGERAGGSSGPPPTPEPAPSSDPLALPKLELSQDRTPRAGSGRRLRTPSADDRGRYVRAAMPDGTTDDIAVGATLRAAIGARVEADPGERGPALAVRPEDLRAKVRERKVGASIIFIVDASGSMGARRRLEAAKGAALTLLTEAYQRRDRVALIAFRGSSAEAVLPLTDSVELVERQLSTLPTGGRTPLAEGLRTGLELIRQLRLKDRQALAVPVLITDGKANATSGHGSPVEEALAAAGGYQQPGVHSLVLDTENDFLTFGLAARVAERAGARYVRLADLSAESVAASVQGVAAALA